MVPRAKGKVTRAIRKANLMAKAKTNMENGNQRRDMRKAKAKLTTGLRQRKERQTMPYMRQIWALCPGLLAKSTSSCSFSNTTTQSSDAVSVQQSGPQGSATSLVAGNFTQVSSVSQQPSHGQQQTQSSQFRVAKIVEDAAVDLVFDLTSRVCHGGSVRVVHYHIGDDDDDGRFDFPCGVRTVIEEVLDEGNLTTILLDSGADASVFPMFLMEAGVPTSCKGIRLCDAQGRPIPVEGTRLVEIRLPTRSGRSILLKERVAFSFKI
jgi:hypothetical protein